DLHLCQQIICHNPARLPGPAAWVNVKRVRLKDSFTHVWWMSRSPTPKADNRRVLTPYSSDMRKLLKTQRYNAGRRPSGHVISERGFLNDHGGAIAPHVIDLDPIFHAPHYACARGVSLNTDAPETENLRDQVGASAYRQGRCLRSANGSGCS